MEVTKCSTKWTAMNLPAPPMQFRNASITRAPHGTRTPPIITFSWDQLILLTNKFGL